MTMINTKLKQIGTIPFCLLLLILAFATVGKSDEQATTPQSETATALENPLIPMGAITGKPTREQIRTRLSEYRAVGITQFLLYPRAGCELEYMSDEWLQTCEIICDEAQKLGFTSLWLYDEFNWPSGTCNKEVMKVNPDFQMQQLCVYPEGNEYKVVLRRNPKMSALTNPDAVDCFIKMTHERYYAKLGKYFGTLIKGIFTDEPDIGYFDRSNREDVFRMGWYDGLIEDYAKATNGRKLFDDVADGVKRQSLYFAGTCNRLLAERFRTVFVDRVETWCKNHRIQLTGHLMNEVRPQEALSSSGHPLPVLSGMGLPGIDEIFTRNTISGIEWLTLSTGMYAIEKQGNKGGLAELFALGPCDLDFTRLIKQIYFTAAFGIDHYVLAVAQLDSRGNSIKDQYYNPYSPDQPHIAVWNTWGKIAARAAVLAKKERLCEVNIRYPYSVVNLPEFIREMVRHQCGWRLLLSGEKPDPEAKAVFEFTLNGIRDEKSRKLVHNFKDFYEQQIRPRQGDKVVVLDEKGALASDVFLRRFKDGSALVIDCSGQTRELFWQRQGTTTPFVLEAEGIAELPGWQVVLDRPNTMRLEFDAETNEYQFELSEPVNDLQLAVRWYGGEVEMELDGQKIKAVDKCQSLSAGFNDLYYTKALALKQGKHRVKLLNKAPYYAFLPHAFLTGSFSRINGTNILSNYRGDGMNLSGYTGTITQKGTVLVPADAIRASVGMTSGDVELMMNGVSCGVRLTAPYRWGIPESLRGQQVEVTVIRHTTAAPMFGQTRKKTPLMPKNDTPIPGLIEIIWE